MQTSASQTSNSLSALNRHLLKLKLVAVAVLCAASSAMATTQPPERVKFELPSFAATILENQFPEIRDGADLSALRKYRQELETFRQFVLEKYNKGIIDYAKRLDDASKLLEEQRRTHKVSTVEYHGSHARLKDEFARISKEGEYMQVYYAFFEKYKGQAKWVATEIKHRERQGMKF